AQFRRAARTKARTSVVDHSRDSDLITLRDESALWLNGQEPFHWPLEFPEVIVERSGFDGIVCNPPFIGGQKITGVLGTSYRNFLVDHIAKGKKGSADLSA